MPQIITRIKSAWNAFLGRDPTVPQNIEYDYGPSYSIRPDRQYLRPTSERSLVGAIYNRIAIDVASVAIRHVRLDENDRYLHDVDSDLNSCLKLGANIDQTGRALIQDAVQSMCDEGCVAIVPIDTTTNPDKTTGFDIQTMRVGKIIQWYPSAIKVRVYDENEGIKKEIIVPKRYTAIIENPLYSVMNEPNSTLQRLVRTLSQLDSLNSKTTSESLDIIIQLPYAVKSELRRQQAEERRADLEAQLRKSPYGIGYIDGTEKIVQLNRSIENQMLSQVEYLTSMLFSQLGLTEEVFNGTADEKTMLNYHNRTIEPILSAITVEMKRKWLSKTAITQHESIEFFRDPFKLVPVSQIADIADKFTRNEVLSSNEVRSIVGYKPVQDPRADELRNKNLNQSNEEVKQTNTSQMKGDEKGELKDYAERILQTARTG